MNNLKIPDFIPGPPGTGKTHVWLKKEYAEFLKADYKWDRIVVLSHTNTAADEIIKAVKNLSQLKNVPVTKLEDQICTIHSYFKGEYLPLNKYEREDHEKFCDENTAMKNWNKGRWDKHPLYTFCSQAHGKGMTFDEYWRVCDTQPFKPYNVGHLKYLKKEYDAFRKTHKKLSFEDMIDNFRFRAEIPTNIDILIVDEAQDCSKPQIKALQKAATNAKRFIFIGDPDQTIHEYAGSDPNFFYKLASTSEAKANELKEGLRCGKTINEICKNIIVPVWDKWGINAKRTWTHVEGVVGNSYWIPNIEQSCEASEILINKILNTGETFLFTYRGNPTYKHINTFLQKNGIDYKLVSSDKPHVSRKDFRCFKTWSNFLNDKVSKKQIIEYWPLMGQAVKVRGKGEIDKLKPLIDQEYNIQEFIEMGFIKPEAKQYKDFSEVVIKKDLIEKIPFIKKVLKNNMDVEKMPRVEHDTIHKVKGLTYDNVIVDLSVYRREKDIYEPIRLAYVAYSRGKIDCWSVGTSNYKNMPGGLAGIQNHRGEILKL